MEIQPSFLSATAAQLQARFESSQAQRALEAAEGAARKAEQAVKGSSTDAGKEAAMKRLQKVSRDFESIFLGYLLKTMRDATPKSEFLGHSRESEIWGAMKDEEVAKSLAQAGGIGLSKLMVDQLKRSL